MMLLYAILCHYIYIIMYRSIYIYSRKNKSYTYLHIIIYIYILVALLEVTSRVPSYQVVVMDTKALEHELALVLALGL